jgi:hypothetical protein
VPFLKLRMLRRLAVAYLVITAIPGLHLFPSARLGFR